MSKWPEYHMKFTSATNKARCLGRPLRFDCIPIASQDALDSMAAGLWRWWHWPLPWQTKDVGMSVMLVYYMNFYDIVVNLWTWHVLHLYACQCYYGAILIRSEEVLWIAWRTWYLWSVDFFPSLHDPKISRSMKDWSGLKGPIVFDLWNCGDDVARNKVSKFDVDVFTFISLTLPWCRFYARFMWFDFMVDSRYVRLEHPGLRGCNNRKSVGNQDFIFKEKCWKSPTCDLIILKISQKMDLNR